MDQTHRYGGIVFLASDHGGYQGKAVAASELESMGIAFEDLGTDSEASVDYPDYGVAAARRVAENPGAFGIIFCGTGIGISIAANKIAGIRAALCTSEYHAEMARAHNDANILAMGARVSSEAEIRAMIRKWFATEFEGGRHQKRIEKIHNLTGC